MKNQKSGQHSADQILLEAAKTFRIRAISQKPVVYFAGVSFTPSPTRSRKMKILFALEDQSDKEVAMCRQPF